MVTQQVLLCDDQGKFNGKYLEKEKAHTGKGKKHLAITVLIYNKKGQVLLQKRKHKRFDNMWDFTGATDVLHKKDGTDETVEEASLRCLKREYEINSVDVKDLQNLGGFSYFVKYNHHCENEYCLVLVGEYSGKLKLNPEVGYGFKWVSKKEFLQDIKKNPSEHTAWAFEGVKILKQKGFFK